ncbi:MAG: hypothetical protein DYG94_00075 [Leptolyngbya sp. PLA3]|nr:MAG: hypothetical protein EDM82_01800 [Cyanobacteria bacterium CYA]MCE7967133.1 hypothetical protein [Leptolyngbya sp. PL-A3]
MIFTPNHRIALSSCIGDYLNQIGRPARIIAVGATHSHVLFRCGREDAKSFVASAKRSASQRTRAFMPGSIWAQGCNVVRVRDEQHYRAIVEYIMNHREQGAAIWEHPRAPKAPVN